MIKDKAHANRLVNETNPYLLQHAHNPVNWYAWGGEAFAAAKAQDKPIFLSIGYSSCHWCHVMERESFEDQSTADILNANFIAIKVDREERPDIDAIYMTAVQALTGSGGWPLNIFLTPELKPFFGGTYFAPDGRYGSAPFKVILTTVAQAWKDRRGEIAKSAEGLTESILSHGLTQSDGGAVAADAPRDAVDFLKRSFDKRRGGFGGAPKFPQAAQLSFLLRYYSATGDAEVLEMVTRTMDAMACGGIYDQLGGGFHRYSVDAGWQVPHFEKMLYDNALLTLAYLEAYQVTARPMYARVARETLDYVLRDLTCDEGGFQAAEDADSEGVEGKFYVWSKAEIDSLLAKEEAEDFCKYYGVTRGGNFEGQNILHVTSQEGEGGWKALQGARKKLLEVRSKRLRPGKDYKVISAWNGMMISAFAAGLRVLGDGKYLAAAERAAGFMKSSMMEGGNLARSYAGGRRGPLGFVDDYANAANSFLDLYESTWDVKWLRDAESLASRMTVLFGDKERGGLYFSSGQDKSLLTRRKDYADDAARSGNSVAVLLFYRLARLTGRSTYADMARGILSAAGPLVSEHPFGYLNMLSSAYFETLKPVDIVIIGRRGAADTTGLIAVAWRKFIPGAVTVVADDADAGYAELQKSIPLLEGRAMIGGKAVAYVCVGRTCNLPVGTGKELERLIDSL